MKLSDFEDFIEEKILERGFTYFEENRISAIVEIEKDHFKAEIEGSTDYVVDVWLQDNDIIINSNCSCPYDWGEFCKHQAAVFYELREMGEKIVDSGIKKKKTEQVQKKDIRRILGEQSKEHLIDIIMDMIETYPGIQEQILLKYATGSEEMALCKKIMKESINKAKSRGFIEWNKVSRAMSGPWTILHKANEKLKERYFADTVMICVTVLSTVVDVLETSKIGNLIYWAHVPASAEPLDFVSFLRINWMTHFSYK